MTTQKEEDEGGKLPASALTLESVQAATLALLPLSMRSVQDDPCPAPNLLALLLWPLSLHRSFFPEPPAPQPPPQTN